MTLPQRAESPPETAGGRLTLQLQYFREHRAVDIPPA